MDRELLHSGGFLNARVYVARGEDGRKRIEKDFSECPWLVRNTLGRFLVWRETWMLRRLGGVTKAVPGGVVRLSAFALAEDFVDGPSMRETYFRASREGLKAASGKIFPHEFFDRFDAGISEIHAAGFVHLDLHNARNVMVAPGWRPVFVDWQSALPTRFMPGFLRRALERIDEAGALKFRAKFRPMDVSAGDRRRLDRANFFRRHFWLPRLRIGEAKSGSGLSG